jgi:pimeloyl-ACP methyl ester carboxylesterase
MSADALDHRFAEVNGIRVHYVTGALTGGLNYYRAASVGPGDGAPARSFGDPARLIVRVPTLVIWGERDQALLTGNLDGLDRSVPDLTIERIPDGSHWVVNEQPERVNRLIRDFLGPRRAAAKEAR